MGSFGAGPLDPSGAEGAERYRGTRSYHRFVTASTMWSSPFDFSPTSFLRFSWM